MREVAAPIHTYIVVPDVTTNTKQHFPTSMHRSCAIIMEETQLVITIVGSIGVSRLHTQNITSSVYK